MSLGQLAILSTWNMLSGVKHSIFFLASVSGRDRNVSTHWGPLCRFLFGLKKIEIVLYLQVGHPREIESW
jgi:hypothetical protein